MMNCTLRGRERRASAAASDRDDFGEDRQRRFADRNAAEVEPSGAVAARERGDADVIFGKDDQN